MFSSIFNIIEANAAPYPERVYSTTLLPASTISNLKLNITSLPTISHSGYHSVTVKEGNWTTPAGMTQYNIRLQFTNAANSARLDDTVTAMFTNCGTLNGRAIDMKLVYSDIVITDKSMNVSAFTSRTFTWTAFGTVGQQTDANEWFAAGFKAYTLRTYIYYSGESTPIHLSDKYISFYSEDGYDDTDWGNHHEATCSSIAKASYLYTNNTMGITSEYVGNKYYSNIVYGKVYSATNEDKYGNAVCYYFEDTDYLEVDMLVLDGIYSRGYHINLSAFATAAEAPTKSVNATQVYENEAVIWTINQKLPTETNSSFRLGTFKIMDTIDETKVQYQSCKVYNEQNVDITNSAGTLSKSGSKLTYTFSSSYLSNLRCRGQMYKMVISTTAKTNLSTFRIYNKATTQMNDYEMDSNTVMTEVQYKIDTKLTGRGTITGVTGSTGGTGGIYHISGGSTKTVSWQAAEDYYVTSVKIDGNLQTFDDVVLQGSKTFSNINANHAVEVVTKPRPRFDIVKSADKPYYNANDIVTFTISFKIQDNTAEKAYDVKFEDLDMTKGLTLDKNSIKVYGLDGINYTAYTSVKNGDNEVVHCDIPVLPAGKTVTVTYQAKVENDFVAALNENANNNIYNTARVTCKYIITKGNDPKWEIAQSVTPVLKPIVTIVKNSDKAKYNVGDTVTYQITVDQTKKNAIAHNVVVTDKDYTKGIKMTLNSESDVQVCDVQGNTLDSSLYTVSIDGNENFTVTLSRLEYNQPVVISVKGIITDEKLAGKNIKNKADATCENNPKDVTDETTALVYMPNLVISKVADREDKTYDVKDYVTYTVRVDQTVEGARANYVVVEDTLPDGFDLDKNSFKVYKNSISEDNKLSEGYSLTDASATSWLMQIDDITDSCFIVYRAKIVDARLVGKTDLKNVVIAQATNFFDPATEELITVEDDEIVGVTNPNLEIKKTADKEIYNVGDTIKYTVEVEETVNMSRANDVVINDKIGTSGVFIRDYSTFEIIDDFGDALTETDSEDIEFTNGDYYFTKKTEEEFEINVRDLSAGKLVIHFDAVIEDGKLAGKKVTNTVQTSASNFLRKIDDENFEPIIREAKSIVFVATPNVVVTKEADKDYYNVGDEVVYTVNVKQIEENARANGVVISDRMATADVDINMDSIKIYNADNEVLVSGSDYEVINKYDEKTHVSGFDVKMESITDEVTIIYSATIKNNDTAGNSIINDVIVSVSNLPDNEPTAHSENPVLEPMLEVYKESDRDDYNVGDLVEFTITAVQLVPNARANDVVITDEIFEDALSLSYETIHVFYNDNEIHPEINQTDKGFVIPVGNISDKDVVTIKYTCIIKASNLASEGFVNTASAVWSNGPSNPGGKTAKSEGRILKPDLSIAKVADKAVAYKDEIVKYTVTVNQADVKAKATNVIVNDVIEDNMEIDEKTIVVSSSDISFDANTIKIVKNEDGFSVLIPQISGKQQVTISYDAKVLSDTRNTSTNIVTVTDDTMPRDDEKEIEKRTAKVTIEISETPQTGESNTLPIAMTTLVISFGLMLVIAYHQYVKRKKLMSFDV